MKKKISITVEEKIVEGVDSRIDNLFIRNRSQAVEHLLKQALGENRVAIILAGGDPEKLKIADGIYRPIAKINGKTIIEMAILRLREFRFKKIFVIASHEILTKIFDIVKDGSGLNVAISYVEDISPKGSADSLRKLRGKISSSFLVVFGHIIFDKIKLEELWQQHMERRTLATLLLTTSDKPSEKGIVRIEGMKILEFVQKPRHAEEYLVFSPIFVAEPEIFDIEGNSLEYDVFPNLVKKGLLEGHISSEKEIHIHSIEDIYKLKNK